MKKFSSRFKVLMGAGLCAVAGIVLFWLSDEGKFNGYDMVKRESTDTSDLLNDVPSWYQYVPGAILDLFQRDYGTTESYCVRLNLPEHQQDELGRIFSNVDLLHDGVSIGGVPFIGPFGSFLVPIGDELYLLTMYYSGPVPNGYYGAKEFSIHKVKITRQGRVVDDESGQLRFFSLPELHDQLEWFLKELPESSEARQQYEGMKKLMKDIIDQSMESDQNFKEL